MKLKWKTESVQLEPSLTEKETREVWVIYSKAKRADAPTVISMRGKQWAVQTHQVTSKCGCARPTCACFRLFSILSDPAELGCWKPTRIEAEENQITNGPMLLWPRLCCRWRGQREWKIYFSLFLKALFVFYIISVSIRIEECVQPKTCSGSIWMEIFYFYNRDRK